MIFLEENDGSEEKIRSLKYERNCKIGLCFFPITVHILFYLKTFSIFFIENTVGVMNEHSIKPVIMTQVVLSSPWGITDVARQFPAVVSYNNAYYEVKSFKQVK